MATPSRHSPDRVWPVLAEPGRLAQRSPFVPDRVLDSLSERWRGESRDEPHDPEVLVLDPRASWSHRWGDDLVRWT